jgi:hypothetical protein
MESQEIAITIGAISALIIGFTTVFFKYINTITKADRSERIKATESNAKALCLLSKALAANTASNQEIAKETKRSADEARQRNGHLADLMKKAQETAVSVADRNLKAYQDMDKQHIHIQEVDKQKVKVKE